MHWDAAALTAPVQLCAAAAVLAGAVPGYRAAFRAKP